MRKLLVFILLLITLSVSFSCTSNSRARVWGGEEAINLDKNEVVMTATWKHSDIWLLIKDTVKNELYLKEYSQWGVLQGKLNIK